jgi:hypothetical protein
MSRRDKEQSPPRHGPERGGQGFPAVRHERVGARQPRRRFLILTHRATIVPTGGRKVEQHAQMARQAEPPGMGDAGPPHHEERGRAGQSAQGPNAGRRQLKFRHPAGRRGPRDIRPAPKRQIGPGKKRRPHPSGPHLHQPAQGRRGRLAEGGAGIDPRRPRVAPTLRQGRGPAPWERLPGRQSHGEKRPLIPRRTGPTMGV